ncbi:MAG: MFS transporter [Anaerolineae bacterium]|jgi:MFS family permease
MNRDTRLIALALLLWGFGEGLFFHIQPLYFEQLGATPVQIGGLVSIAGAVRAVSFLPAGILADRLPRKWVMLGGWITGLTGVLLVGSARSWRGLIPGLLLYALSGYCIPVINAYLAHAADGRNLPRVFTAVFAAYAAGGVISPAVGGWLSQSSTMRSVYLVSALLFAFSMLAVLWVSPQPVPGCIQGGRRWLLLLNRRFLGFAGLVCLTFVAMYLAFPLASNYLHDARGWSLAGIGTLGSFQALGAALLSPLLGRLGGRSAADGYPLASEEAPPSGGRAGGSPLGRTGGLIVGQALVWGSTLILLMAGTFPVLAVGYLLRGAYQGCRSLTQARAIALATEGNQGLMLGATETTIAAAQVVAPYAAGWLYANSAANPFIASLVLIPVAIVLLLVGLGP